MSDLHNVRKCVSGTDGCYGPGMPPGETYFNLTQSRCPWCVGLLHMTRAERAEKRIEELRKDLEIIRAVVNYDR